MNQLRSKVEPSSDWTWCATACMRPNMSVFESEPYPFQPHSSSACRVVKQPLSAIVRQAGAHGRVPEVSSSWTLAGDAKPATVRAIEHQVFWVCLPRIADKRDSLWQPAVHARVRLNGLVRAMQKRHCLPASRTRRVRPRPALFRALGAAEPPPAVEVAGERYALVEVYKHDSWAATALYANERRRVVCKFNRCYPILGLPTAWLGRWLARREAVFLQQLSDCAATPGCLGEVRVGGRPLQHAVAREYIEGHPLARGELISETFLLQLEQALRFMHARRIAYVDLHKRENIIVGQAGQLYLIDFQVAYSPGSSWLGRTHLAQWLFKQLVALDWYNFGKLWRRHFACQEHVPPPERPCLLRWHRCIAGPLRRLRRGLLALLGIRERGGRADTEFAPEAAYRTAVLVKLPERAT